MRLIRFEAHGFRNLDEIVLEPHPQLTIVHGTNGAGKSGLLEAIQCLATGHTFRTRQRRDYAAHDGRPLLLAGQLLDQLDGSEHRCGMQRGDDGQLDIRIDYRPAANVAELARLMPVKALVPDSHKLVQDGPDERRRFVDWGCFHASEEFAAVWRRFRRALSQRNEVLRHRGSDDEVRSWDEAVASHGEQLDRLRKSYLEQFALHVKKRAQVVDFPFHMELEWRSGWSDDRSLAQALHTRLEHHRRLKTTADGPHRADLVVKANDRLARPVLSRGQQKMLVYVLHLAQLDCLTSATGKRAIVLCDDPFAELDDEHQRRLLGQLQDTGCQVILTAANPLPAPLSPDASSLDARWLELDRGQVRA